jgi:hypothetical protein
MNMNEIINKNITELRIKTIQEINEKCIEQNIDFLIFKGTALSIQLYGDETRRKSSDIDCIVKQNQLKQFLSIIKGLGFRLLCDNSEININMYEQYIKIPHLVAFNKNVYNIKIVLEIHLTTVMLSLELHFISIYKRPVPNIDIFTDTVELTLKNGNKIYTLSYTINFMLLINHYISHVEGPFLDVLIGGEDKFIYDFLYIEELYLFYKKYKSCINIDILINNAIKCDTIDNIILVNQHFKMHFNDEIYPMDMLMKMSSPNNNIRLAIRRYLFTVSLDELINIKKEDLSVNFYKSIKYEPSKIIYLKAEQMFKEKLYLSSDGILNNKYSYPDYSVLYDGKNLFFTIIFDKRYFTEKFMSINFVVQEDDNQLYKLYHEFHADCSEEKHWYNKIISAVSVTFNKNQYKVNILLENINVKILRYNLFFGNIDIYYWYKDYISTCNTPDVLDIIKCYELHLN